jgi:hypothetical protein
MEHVIVGTAAFLVATLSVFTGFGLGTVLLPVFAIFFSAGLAVGATALVHGAANVLKVALLGRHAVRWSCDSAFRRWPAPSSVLERSGSSRDFPRSGHIRSVTSAPR